MASDRDGADGALSGELSSFVAQLNGAHIVIDRDYRIVAANDAYRSTMASGTEVVGRRCFEVSHGYAVPCDQAGETCPRQQALASGHHERVLHVHYTSRGEEHVEIDLYPLRSARGHVGLFVEHLRPLPTARPLGGSSALIGRAPGFLAMLELVARVAPTDTNVLLLGETGTGKEMVARAIHDASARRAAPFVAVDCSGLAETLVESELFGHEKGAFTGALARKSGLVEAAAGGTLFLDEVGDIPLGLQVKLLRLLETGTFRRVGGVEPQHASFRLIAATHRDLHHRVQDGQFRADLYYRLAAFPIRLPPLRERRSDIRELSANLLGRLGASSSLSEPALACLARYEFPGNVRELRNLLERANLLADGPTIGPRHLPEDLRRAPSRPHRRDLLHAAERRAFETALAEHHGSRGELASRLGISERTLYRRLRQFGLSQGRLE
jgi:DNA-binding NtrC family response regulator